MYFSGHRPCEHEVLYYGDNMTETPEQFWARLERELAEWKLKHGVTK